MNFQPYFYSAIVENIDNKNKNAFQSSLGL